MAPDRFVPELRTGRLVLRAWRAEDREPFARLNADAEVMRHLPAPLTREQSDAMIGRIEAAFAQRGWGWFAVEVPGVAPFVGAVGLSVPRYDAPFMPCVEVGWRLAREHWGRGYATEAARAAVAFGFSRLGLAEIVSFTVPANVRSIAVMRRIGMTRDPSGDFDHPALPEGHPLRRHVLHRIRPSA